LSRPLHRNLLAKIDNRVGRHGGGDQGSPNRDDQKLSQAEQKIVDKAKVTVEGRVMLRFITFLERPPWVSSCPSIKATFTVPLLIISKSLGCGIKFRPVS